MLTLEELSNAVGAGDIDTVVVAFTDMQGRLMGKRMEAHFFLEEMEHKNPIEGCNYLLALEMEMDPVPGYEIASWERGYGDFSMVPDFSTMRRVPWLEGTALVLCDVAWNDGTPVRPPPRQVLKAQVDRASALGYKAMFGSELEFFLVKETYAQAHDQHYRGLTPSVPYILDYHILATSYDEPFIRSVRNAMQKAGMRGETSKGEAWPGQHELNFRYSDAVTLAHNQLIYKNGIKEMAQQTGQAVTFMAKPDHTWIGSCCHIHSSLWDGDQALFSGVSPLFEEDLAGKVACAGEFAVFLATNINSYKRYAAGSWAPTTLAWGYDNRTCGFRVVGHGQGLRTESRIPGGDANPSLVLPPLRAAGLQGIEQGLPLPPAFEGN